MAIKKAYIDIADGQIHYRCVAGDGVALIFLHRTPASSATFEQMMISMAGDRPMYALDTPGFGGSFDPPGWPSVTDYRNWLIEAIDGLNIEAFHLFGHHTGTHLATEIAASLTDRTRSLMLNGVAYLTANEREQFRGMVADAVLPDADGRYLSETWQVIRGLFAEFDPELVHREFVGAMRAMQGRDQAFAAIWECRGATRHSPQSGTRITRQLWQRLSVQCSSCRPRMISLFHTWSASRKRIPRPG